MSEQKTGSMFGGGKASKGLILVVDDEPDIRKIVRMTLEKDGYDIIEAEDGEKAIQQIKSGENPLVLDAAIMDIRMPKVNGVEAITFFQQQFPRVPIIVLTGHPNVEMAATFLKQGVVDYLTKPVEREKLQASVAKAMEQRELSRL